MIVYFVPIVYSFNRYHPLHNHIIDAGEVPSEDLMGSFLPLMWTFTWLVADIVFTVLTVECVGYDVLIFCSYLNKNKIKYRIVILFLFAQTLPEYNKVFSCHSRFLSSLDKI